MELLMDLLADLVVEDQELVVLQERLIKDLGLEMLAV
jgi:hypothetical protein